MKIGKIKFSICTFQFAISNIITRHGGTGTTRQWTPRVNGRHASMDASRQWTPRLCLQRILNQHVPLYEKKYHFVESTLVERGEIIEK